MTGETREYTGTDQEAGALIRMATAVELDRERLQVGETLKWTIIKADAPCVVTVERVPSDG